MAGTATRSRPRLAGVRSVPGARREEGVQLDAPGEVVDHADEAGERALGDDLEDVRGVVRPPRAGAPRRRPCRGRARAAARARTPRRGAVRRRLAGAHRSISVVDAQAAEHGRVERDAVAVVDGDSDREAGDLARDGVENARPSARRRSSNALMSAGDAAVPRHVGDEAEVVGDGVEERLATSPGAASGVRGAPVVDATQSPPSTSARQFPAREVRRRAYRRYGRAMAVAESGVGTRRPAALLATGARQEPARPRRRRATTARYVSFVETGRSQPSRQMVLRLARALDVPLRERNGLLLAAGYAPLYRAATLDAPELDRVATR